MKSIFLTLIAIQICATVFCQKQVEIEYKNGKISLHQSNDFDKTNIAPSLYNDQYYVIVQLKAGLTKTNFKNNEITLFQYLGNKIYAATFNKTVQTLPNDILYYGNLPNELKYSNNQLINIENNKNNYVAISYFGISKDTIINLLQKEGVFVKQVLLENNSILCVNYKNGILQKLAKYPFINQLIINSNEPHLLNDESKKAHGTTSITSENGRNLNGKGITIGHGDLGYPRDHIDLSSKSIDHQNATIGNFHGNHTSGIASGAGIINEKYIGIAPKSPTINSYFDDVISNTPSFVIDYNMVATNNSYYTGLEGCPGNRLYNNLSVFIDSQSFQNKSNLHIFAAGNDGTLSCSPFIVGFGTIKGGYQTGKNVLSVGSLNTDTYTNAALSSKGPTADGRIKPEIIAKGENVTSTVPVNIYDFTTGGTSMAAPVVTGAAALLQQRYKQLHSVTANSDMVKVLLCNSADDLGNTGPDFTYGFGMLNVRKSIEALENNQYFTGTINSTGSINTHTFNVPTNTRRVKAMLYWIDKEGTLVAMKNLVNDLNLTLTEPSAVVHTPYILDATPSNVNNVAVEGRDSLNNIEQCIINNPTVGAYTITVSGYEISNPNQNYVVVYELEKNGITVEFPYGGEKVVPTEIEKIRWTAYGNEANTFTIEYSLDNGSSWNLIDNNVANTARKYDWTVPNMPTSIALVRVSRNATALVGTSTTNFTILGVPTVTVTNSCNGAAAINWTSVASATNYEVMVNDADSMKIVGTTASTSYIATGLNTNQSYWFTVRAMLGAKAGRRAVAKNITPTTGPCTDAVFDNDIKLVSINTPNTGRHLTSDANNALQSINITLLNNDNVVSNTTFDVKYSINGGATITETITPTINAGTTTTHTFATHSPSTLPANYTIKVWVAKASDANNTNDTLVKQVDLLPNALLTLPFNDGFETTAKATYFESKFGFTNNTRYDFNSNSNVSRARTFVNTGFAKTGSNAVTLDQFYYGILRNDTLKGTFNISNLDTSNNQVRADVYVRNQGQESNANNKIWIRGSDVNNWIEAFDLNTLEPYVGKYRLVAINVNDVLASATPKQQYSSSFQIAYGEGGSNIASNVNPIDTREDGYTFDDISIVEAFNDIAVTEIVNPKINSCNTTSNTAITINVKNYSKVTQNSINVSYSINGASPVTETIAVLNASQNIQYTFTTLANMASFTDYTISVWVSLATDTYKNNDSIINFEFHNSPLISTFPHLERFEANNGNWFTKGTNNSWAWGTPTQPTINRAANGANIWATSLTTGYNDNEKSYLTSPCFDLSALTNPTLSFSFFNRIEDDCPCDYAWMEYSSNGGLTWSKLGSVGAGTNWYDNASKQAWQLSNAKWHVATITIPTNAANTKFRFVMESDGGVALGGLGVDDIHIYDGSAPIYTGATLTTGLSNTVNGTSWIDFKSGTNIIASINANGNNLGITDAAIYQFVGAVRTSNNQFYVNRNIVVQPTTPPTTDVTVRLHFTDVEVNDLLNAPTITCPTCTKPRDAYEFGITKYSGPISEENGNLGDNTIGANHTFLLPGQVDVIPYMQGYYAEYAVNSFSEFWLNNGGTGLNQPLPLQDFIFTVIKQNNDALLKWNYITPPQSTITIERSINGINFNVINNIAYSNSNYYTAVDATIVKSVLYYYRIKVQLNNGTIQYSPTRLFSIDGAAQIVVMPNPNKGNMQVQSNEFINEIKLYNAIGKLVWYQKTNSTIVNILLPNLQSGQYTLKCNTAKTIIIKKIQIL